VFSPFDAAIQNGVLRLALSAICLDRKRKETTMEIPMHHRHFFPPIYFVN
jgi:hypothetical protein